MTEDRRVALEAELTAIGEEDFRKRWTTTSLPDHDPDVRIATAMIAELDRRKAVVRQDKEDDRTDRAVDRARERNWIGFVVFLLAAVTLALRMLGVV